ncbi:redoxin domain-containing protein [Uliginosibacterium sp. H1]|uniref:redoxin domain-containing protein n=1 Tax=Uliginosibacterium sp. H1 TaxID=3114757 RepID=UPI002E1789DC|nr:redoxin domain-containing protein [Uliginosibacterium sp. H1]
MSEAYRPAPPWQVRQWFNTTRSLSLEDLRGKVVVLESFQMLCPGCVAHGLPQAQRVRATFPRDQVAVIGLHTVFEHHAAMTPTSLEAFLYEYRIDFPVGVDKAGDGEAVPQTMRAYAMRGTPTLTLIDTRGRLRHQHFGQVSDLLLGAQIAQLVQEAAADTEVSADRAHVADNATDEDAVAGACSVEGGCEP